VSARCSVLILICAGLFGGCFSTEEWIAERRDRLVKIYPLGTTTRTDVAAKWLPTKPELSFSRPSSGWLDLDQKYFAAHLDALERKIGKPIASFERYLGADGFFSLCRCWFYYDSSDHLIDVEWQYVSD
jgi:hypothetical protein